MRLPAAVPLRSLAFGVLCVSTLSSKFLLLRIHFNSISTASLLLYLPSLLLSDVLVIVIGRLLLANHSQRWSPLAVAAGCLASLSILAGASSQIGFYAVTGGDIDWRDAGTYAKDWNAFAVLLSGLTAVLLSGLALLVAGAVVGSTLYQLSGNVIGWVQGITIPVFNSLRGYGGYARVRDVDPNDIERPSERESPAGEGSDCSEKDLKNGSSRSEGLRRTPPLLAISAALTALYILGTWLIRPDNPYDRVAETLPLALLGVFSPHKLACLADSLANNRYPFPELIASTSWKKPFGDFYKGWAPSGRLRPSPLAEAYEHRDVAWLPEGKLPHGFLRWDPARFETEPPQAPASANCNVTTSAEVEQQVYYNPVSDPLKITNLDHEILPALREALGDGKVKIEHVVLVAMEALRLDVWPIQKDAHFYNMFTRASDESKREEVDQLLSEISPNIERITGVPMGFKHEGDPVMPTFNDNAAADHGGINVAGAYSAATTTIKSFSALHCGTSPMPVDTFEEFETYSYQPCLPQIYDMFNLADGPAINKSTRDDFRNRPWRTALFTATIEQYEGLEVFDDKMGFHYRVARQEIEQDKVRFDPSNIMDKMINYFSYPEPVLLPYIEEYLDETLAARERLFMTHLTSTTHHPWDMPSDFPLHTYMPRPGIWGWRADLDKYLNSIKYHDQWMGTLLDLLDRKGMANDTLVVFVGDHGHAFKEDAGKEGTYENDHLANMRVGLTFRHPHLPRVQYDANMTTISILPTILDLLISSGSLNGKSTEIASDLVHEYEGQSAIRPYQTKDGSRRAWVFTIINPGGGRLSVTSADVPWRLTMPLSGDNEYGVTNVVIDPLESHAIKSWTVKGLVEAVAADMGKEAAEWAAEAIPTAEWWAKERRRLWRYHI